MAFEDEYQKNLGDGAYLIEYALEILNELYKEYDLYVVTNGVARTQYNRLDLLDLRKYFKNSQDVKHENEARKEYQENFINDDIKYDSFGEFFNSLYIEYQQILDHNRKIPILSKFLLHDHT